MTPEEKMDLKVKVNCFFRPGTPIDTQRLLAGRHEQINDVLNGALQPGRHVIMFGERGVGKTSLAKVISEIIRTSVKYKLLNCGTINCETGDSFNTLWRRIFREISFAVDAQPPGFRGKETSTQFSLDSILPGRELDGDDVRYMLNQVPEHKLIIIDELDRLKHGASRSKLADTIKTLSDHASDTTLLLVGVADAVSDLVAEHQSIDRALVQVPMPRMSVDELTEIVDTGLISSGMTAESGVSKWIASLSQGLPYYTHSLGLYSAFKAVEADRTRVTWLDVLEATKTTVSKSHLLHSDYTKATVSPKKQNLFPHVVRACALADTDELGYFSAAAVSGPMSAIMSKKYSVSSFSRNLAHLCTSRRGAILKKTGPPRGIRFRFSEAMMQAFVIIHDYANGTLTNEILQQSKGRSKEASSSRETSS